MQQQPGDIPDNVLQLVRTMVQHPTFKTLMTAVRARTPGRPSTDQAPSTAAQQAFLRQGFEEAIELVESIAFENPNAGEELPAVLDPRD